MNQGQIRIVIVDDHQMIRETWRLLLEQDGRFAVIAECSNGNEGIEKAIGLQPDVVLMDINMHPVNGFEATRKIIKQSPHLRIIGMSINNQPSYARNLLLMGAKGYVTKNSTKEEMMEAILEVHRGGQYICREIRNKFNDDGE